MSRRVIYYSSIGPLSYIHIFVTSHRSPMLLYTYTVCGGREIKIACYANEQRGITRSSNKMGENRLSDGLLHRPQSCSANVHLIAKAITCFQTGNSIQRKCAMSYYFLFLNLCSCIFEDEENSQKGTYTNSDNVFFTITVR